MLKKIISMATATLLLAGGVTAFSISTADASTTITQLSITATGAPMYQMPKTAMSFINGGLNQEWQVTSTTWSPSVASTFDSNTVYVATVTLSANLGFVFNNIPTNGFTVTGAGSTGVTDSSTAVAVGANSTSFVIQITFPATNSGVNNNVQMISTTVLSNLTETSVDIDFGTLAAAHSSVSTWNVILYTGSGQSHADLSTTPVSGSTHVLSITGLTPGTTYGVFIADPSMTFNNMPGGYEPGKSFTTLGSGASPSTPTVDTAAIAAAAARAVAAAKTTVVETLKSGKPITAADLNAADIRVASEKAAERVNTKLLALPAEKRSDIATVAALVRTENFVDKASTAATQASVTTNDLVVEKLLSVDYKYKATVLRAVIASSPAALDSIEKVDAVVKAAIASVQARKARLAAIIAKINGTPAK